MTNHESLPGQALGELRATAIIEHLSFGIHPLPHA
jgi:hypothetical protein